MKFVGVQAELIYTAPCIDFVWVSILNCDGEIKKAQVDILYPQLPYSCSLCQGFGHSLSRCSKNPEATRPAPRARNESKRPIHESQHQTNESQCTAKQPRTEPHSVGKDCGTVVEYEKGDSENYVDNLQNAMVPYVRSSHKKKAKSQISDLGIGLVATGAPGLSPVPPGTDKGNCDKEGFTPIISKCGLRRAAP
ncbi:uncharacterized protein LOC141677558 [Apium graveolens]|uniref:uncharacterized protein LOC141677558 n=1 Tax=Apium graveolens TaxID=4045 RepID=UPI003D7B5BC6